MKGEKTVVRLMEDLKLAREVGRAVLLASFSDQAHLQAMEVWVGPGNESRFSNSGRTITFSLFSTLLSALLISGESSHFTCSGVSYLCAENRTAGEQGTASGI